MNYNRHDIERPSTLAELDRWIKHAKAGMWCLYWEGFLPLDIREETRDVQKGAQFSHYPAHVVRGLARNAFDGGLAVLCQQKVGHRHFRYFLVRK